MSNKVDAMIRGVLIEFFSRSLTSFQASNDAFRVLCTLPRHNDPAPRRPQSLQSLIVLDSSFNPPTVAHLRMARSALQAAAGDVRLLLLLAVNNADKKPKPVAFPMRLGLMCAFAEDLLEEVPPGGGVEVDLGLTTMPYFHDKSQVIDGDGFYPPGVEQIYLAGFDTLVRIFNPKYYNDTATTTPWENGETAIRRALDPFFGRSRLRITMRVDGQSGGESEQAGYLERLRERGLEEVGGKREWGERIEMVGGRPDGELAVSSTKVRQAARKGDEEVMKGLLGRRVAQWVLEEGLYREDE